MWAPLRGREVTCAVDVTTTTVSVYALSGTMCDTWQAVGTSWYWQSGCATRDSSGKRNLCARLPPREGV